MKVLTKIITNVIFFLNFSLATAFAHEAEVVHEEPVPTISPLLLVVVVALLAVAGFVLWKFVLRNPNSQSQEKAVSQRGKNDGSQGI